MAGYFPDVRWVDYDGEKQIATFIGRKVVYIAIYEEHEAAAARASDAA